MPYLNASTRRHYLSSTNQFTGFAASSTNQFSLTYLSLSLSLSLHGASWVLMFVFLFLIFCSSWVWVCDLFVLGGSAIVGLSLWFGCDLILGLWFGFGLVTCLWFLMVVVASSGCEWWVGCFCLGEERYT